MFGNSHFDRVREMFANQFEADGDGFVFRKNSKGAAIHVTVAERDGFVVAFNRRLRWMNWGLIAAILVLILGLVAWDLTTNQEVFEAPMYVGLGLILFVFMLGWFRAWNAPAQALATRSPVAPERSHDEFRRIAMRRMTWSQLGAAATAFAVGLWSLSRRIDLSAGWNRLWLVGAGLLFLLVAYRAYRKWRFDQTGRLD
jgi:hypothetical protein